MLNRVEIKGFKSIREMELELGVLNVVIGANGAGKTNFIAVFELLRQIVEENLQVFVGRAGGADALLHYGRKTTDEILIRLSFGQNGYGTTLVPTAGDSLIFSEELCWFLGRGHSKPYEVPLGSGHSETRLLAEVRARPGRVASHVLETMRSWKVYHFHDTSESAKIKQSGDFGDNIALRPDASNLAAFLFLLREKHWEHYGQIIETIRLAAPFFDDFVLRPTPYNPDRIQLEWREQGSDAYFNARSLSDGTLRFMCLATLLLQPNLPSTVVIDEPELGLHPYAITLLASLLRGAAAKTQVVVSTQSVPLVNQFSPEDIVVVDREDRQSVFRRLDAKAIDIWLDEYGLGDLWEKNIIGGRPQR